ncbi:MAG: hypothetical protein EOO73_09365 [Myxococcales bacterium]|nr:MAG: hypothetical protein EOO73_09365 [Myxococcales bacterium]
MRLASVLCVMSLAAACGGNDSSSGEPDGGAAEGITVEELPAEYARALCEVFTGCIGDLWSFFRPGEDCVKEFTITAEEELATLPDAIAAGRVKYHASQVQKCLDEVVARGCEGLSEREPASCQSAIEGTLAEGEDCELDAECSGNQYCKVASACPGECAPYEQAGEKCASNDHCASGLKCSGQGFCVAPSQAGEACQQGEPDCADGLICLGEDAARKVPGKCLVIEEVLDGKAGDPCSLDESLCTAGFACEIKTVAPLAGECVPRVAAGAACRAAFPDECPDDQYCQLPENPLNPGTCTAKPAAGEPCAKGVGAEANVCAPYARCDAGVCRELAHAGESCSADETCYSGHCDGACVTANACR